MSHFTTLATQITDLPSLTKALADKGFMHVEIHEAPQHLHGYQGDVRKQTAEVIIRRQYVGSASNDMGFKRQENGTFEASISEHDRHKHSPQWLNELTQRYAYHVATAKLEEQGFVLISDEKQSDGRLHLVARRMI